jgi:hypothetical protein
MNKSAQKMFSFKQCSCVLAARMNPAIIMPRWLHKNNICGTPEAECQIQIDSSGVSYRFNQDDFLWLCSPLKMEVISTDPSKNPGNIVSQVMKLLEHTPTTACGNNFNYVLDDEVQSKCYELLHTEMESHIVASKYKIVTTSLKYGIAHEDATVSTEYHLEDEKVVEFSFNFHREAGDATQAVLAASKWDSDNAFSQKLATDILKGCISG